MALNLLMLGPPGAGKGTQAERFAKERGIPKISTGDILREAVATKTEIGLRAKAIMDRGELVSDEVMIGIVRRAARAARRAGGFVLDGFPRTVAQAEALDGIMAGRDPLIVRRHRGAGSRAGAAARHAVDLPAVRRPARRSAARSALRARSAAAGWCSGPTTTRRSCSSA